MTVAASSAPGAAWRTSSHSTSNGDCAEVAAWPADTWRKSSHSNSGGCAEVGQDGAVVVVRDTKDRDGAWLAFDAAAWAAFTERLKSA
jgi:hypothetical protein